MVHGGAARARAPNATISRAGENIVWLREELYS